MLIKPVTLEGPRAQLIPMTRDHVPAFFEIAQDAAIWTHYITKRRHLEDMESIVEEALRGQEQQRELPFTIVDKTTGTIVGSTRYLDISLMHRGLEIGWTWLSPACWGTGLNTECKYLLLQHAFETLGAIRVFLKTDEQNGRSRRAIEKLGAKFEGVLRNHMIRDDGTYRHSAYYSIIENEWPGVKERLSRQLERVL